jgi:hypothetical protein
VYKEPFEEGSMKASHVVLAALAAMGGPNAFNFVNPKDDPRSQKK